MLGACADCAARTGLAASNEGVSSEHWSLGAQHRAGERESWRAGELESRRAGSRRASRASRNTRRVRPIPGSIMATASAEASGAAHRSTNKQADSVATLKRLVEPGGAESEGVECIDFSPPRFHLINAAASVFFTFAAWICRCCPCSDSLGPSQPCFELEACPSSAINNTCRQLPAQKPRTGVAGSPKCSSGSLL